MLLINDEFSSDLYFGDKLGSELPFDTYDTEQKWFWPSQDGLNMAHPSVFHGYQDAVASFNGLSLAKVQEAFPCGCNACEGV